jgi:hypothetical protein
MKYDLRLANNISCNDVESDFQLEDLLHEIHLGSIWLTDEYGWRINPASIVLVRPVDDEDERESY